MGSLGHDCRIIGITGGIGAGKSVVSRILRTRGFMVFDCDLEARIIMEGSGEIKQAIAGFLGEDCINTDGSLHRKRIADHVFNDSAKLSRLNEIVHSAVIASVEAVAKEMSRKYGNRGVLFVESAILRSSGLDRLCDAIWIVDAPEDVRLQRACERDKSSQDSIRKRMAAQREELHGFCCDSVALIRNDGIEPLMPQIENLIKTYI